MSESRNISESSLQVKRTFQEKSSNRLNVADIGNEMSSLNCPIIVSVYSSTLFNNRVQIFEKVHLQVIPIYRLQNKKTNKW